MNKSSSVLHHQGHQGQGQCQGQLKVNLHCTECTKPSLNTATSFRQGTGLSLDACTL